MHPVSLRFEPVLESAFREAHFLKSRRTVRLLLGIGALLYGGVFLVFDYFMLPASAFIRVASIRIPVLALLLAALLYSYTGHFRHSWQFVVSGGILLVATSVAAMVVANPDLPMLHDVLAAAFVLYLMITFVIARLPYSHALVTGVALLATYNIAMLQAGRLPIESLLGNNLMLFSALVIGVIAAYLLERYIRSDFGLARMLDAERLKSDRLLLNILPEAVAARLKERQQTIADHHDEVTILFADICGYTRIAAAMPPNDSVALLNTLFSSFDEKAEKYKLEKIKTMGDAYIVAGGLSGEFRDHVEAVANLALEMHEKTNQIATLTGTPLALRIGMHTGPVVAGVIGLHKFSYDLWGDTVNIASRMESEGLPGKIQVTEEVYQRLHGAFMFQERGLVNVKNMGTMKAFLLLGKKTG